MILEDGIRYGARALLAYRMRSGLTMIGIVIGIASVILLTSIGEGARLFILGEFTQFGTNLLAVTPGKTETGGMTSSLGGTIHPLNLGDAGVLSRLPGVQALVPMIAGTAEVEQGSRGRSVVVYGVTSAVPEVWRFQVQQGSFLPEGDMELDAGVTVLGPKLQREMFANENPLGKRVRIAGRRFLVIGVMAPKGQFLGIDLDDAAYIPVGSALPLFNRDALSEIDILYGNASLADSLEARVRRLLIARHEGEEDFTITSQTDMLATMDRILRVVSAAVAGLGGISLLVAAVGILSMMWISVNERTGEIGLAKALGATGGEILLLYLGEAALLSTLGGVMGLLVGLGLAEVLRLAVPGLPVSTPPEYAALALGISFGVGIVGGILPARRAARLDPVEALAAE